MKTKHYYSLGDRVVLIRTVVLQEPVEHHFWEATKGNEVKELQIGWPARVVDVHANGNLQVEFDPKEVFVLNEAFFGCSFGVGADDVRPI